MSWEAWSPGKLRSMTCGRFRRETGMAGLCLGPGGGVVVGWWFIDVFYVVLSDVFDRYSWMS